MNKQTSLCAGLAALLSVEAHIGSDHHDYHPPHTHQETPHRGDFVHAPAVPPLSGAAWPASSTVTKPSQISVKPWT